MKGVQIGYPLFFAGLEDDVLEYLCFLLENISTL